MDPIPRSFLWARAPLDGSTLEVSLTFGPSGPLPIEELARAAEVRGCQVLHDSLRITFTDSLPAWRFQVAAMDRALSASAVSLAQEMSASDGAASFSIVPVRH